MRWELALRFRFSFQILYDTFDLISLILPGKLEFASRGKMKKKNSILYVSLTPFNTCHLLPNSFSSARDKRISAVLKVATWLIQHVSVILLQFAIMSP